MMKQLFALAGFVGISFAAPAASAILSISGPGDWYYQLNKPWFNPPNWIFGPVWSFLYCAMGVAAWLAWRTGNAHTLAWPLGLFLLQLVLNALWTPLFFGMRRPGLALIDIMAMWLAIAATTIAFYSVSRMAAYLLIPYWLWVSFATMLNATIWWLNRG
jgi:tryptophan-rich sensory protein